MVADDKIIDSVWYSIKIPLLSMRQIGIVAMLSGPAKKLKYYIGLSRGEYQEEDEKFIAKWGVPFYPIKLIQWFVTLQKENDEAN